nr:ribonuclease H-like domain-containing protein [Tanacetum cinerariifolium]
MAWLKYDEHSLSTIDNEVGVTSPKSTIQILPSFKEYTSLVTYPKEVEETLGIPMEVEPLDEPQIEDLGLNTSNHDIPLSFREVLIFDEPEPQPNTLPSCPSLDVSLGDKRGPKPPIKPHSPDSFWMKVVGNFIIHTPPLPHVASFDPKDMLYLMRRSLEDLRMFSSDDS